MGGDADVEALLARSRALGADRRFTNFGGGNTSAKIRARDPVTGAEVELLAVKGSGGDLGTLERDGLAVLVLDRLRSLDRVYRGPEREDEMVALLEHCRFGSDGAPPSIDTALHALLPAAHVDHLHPDAVLALATAADGEALVKECYGDAVGWVPWRRPGWELARTIATRHAASPALKGLVLGGHGLVAWADTSEQCEATSRELVGEAEAFLAVHGRPEPLGRLASGGRADVPSGEAGREPVAPDERRSLAARLAPALRGLCSTDARVVASFDDSPAVLDFLAREAAPRLVALGTSCPDHFLRTRVRPLLVDSSPAVGVEALVERARVLHREHREQYATYYRRHAGEASPPMRSADPVIVLVPGIGMWSYGRDVTEARVAGEFYRSAIAVMRGAESVSSYEPITESEKFGVEYWWLEEAKLRRRPAPPRLAGRVAFVTGAASGIGRAIARRLAADGAAVAVADLDGERVETVARELGAAALALTVDVGDERAVDDGLAATCLRFGGVDVVVNNAGMSISKPLLDTTAIDWDLQHRVMARGSFLVSRAAARVLLAQGLPADVVYVVSKNAVAAGPDNLAYGAAKASQEHQVRLLAAELGSHGIRVNGVNPDGVVRDSGIFAGGWGARRAAVYGVPEDELGAFYARRTLLGREVTPEHVAAAVASLVGGDLSLTTGAIIPVDGGLPHAFLR